MYIFNPCYIAILFPSVGLCKRRGGSSRVCFHPRNRSLRSSHPRIHDALPNRSHVYDQKSSWSVSSSKICHILSDLYTIQDVVVTHSVLVLKSLVQSQFHLPTSTQSPLVIISDLAHRIDSIRHPQARACVLWLVGQYSSAPPDQPPGLGPEGMTDWAADVLRKTTKSFIQEVCMHIENKCPSTDRIIVRKQSSNSRS
jgi:hypothetical protein